MTKEELKKLIDQSEGHNLELKQSTSLRQEIGQAVSAFANTDGGIILVGVSPNGEIMGVDIGKKTVEDLANLIKENTDPKIYPQMKIHKVDGKNIIEIVVKESDEKPVFFSNHAYQRVGRTSPMISVSKIRELVKQEKKMLSWDARICDGASLKDIDQKKVDWFLERRESYRNVKKPADMTLEELLVNIVAVSGEVKNPTNAGILFFGHKDFSSILS
jgi:ATP-dependent DNA helicase RecG